MRSYLDAVLTGKCAICLHGQTERICIHSVLANLNKMGAAKYIFSFNFTVAFLQSNNVLFASVDIESSANICL